MGWCNQLGGAYDSHTVGLRKGYCVFGSSRYDDNVWHWADCVDGYWYDQALNRNQTRSDYITSITCDNSYVTVTRARPNDNDYNNLDDEKAQCSDFEDKPGGRPDDPRLNFRCVSEGECGRKVNLSIIKKTTDVILLLVAIAEQATCNEPKKKCCHEDDIIIPPKEVVETTPFTTLQPCPSGLTGDACDEDIDECLTKDYTSICQYGTCTNSYGDFSCHCEPGWEGKKCNININDCLENPCVHGFCQDEHIGFECTCNVGWEKHENGKDCTVNINECWPDNPCGHGTCIDTDGAFNCICDEGWKTIGNETCGKQFKFGVKNVSMTVPSGSWASCGGASNEKIQIKIAEYSQCTTKARKYEAGQENITWNNEDLLSECAGVKPNPAEQTLHVTVIPSIEGEGTIEYCLTFLEVVLNDGTIYRKDHVHNKYRYENFNVTLKKV